MTLHSVCSLNSFYCVDRVCFAPGPERTSTGCLLWSGVFWLSESQLRLPEAWWKSVEDTDILGHQEAVSPGSNPLWRGWLYRLVPKAPPLMECRLGSRYFWNH